jgi:hypothetical protein
MPYDFPIGLGRNPLVHSLFVQQFDEHGDHPVPPGSSLRITDSSDIRDTDGGDNRITD